jgi:hypothetical protein
MQYITFFEIFHRMETNLVKVEKNKEEFDCGVDLSIKITVNNQSGFSCPKLSIINKILNDKNN